MFCPMNIIHQFRLPYRAAESDYLRYKVLIFYRTEYMPYLAVVPLPPWQLATANTSR